MAQTSLLRSFAIQRRVIGALLLREVITRFGRHNIGFLWLFIEPMLFTLGITTLWTLVKVTHGGSLPIAAFALTGYSSILLWRNCSNRIIKAIEVNHSLLYHRNVRVLDVFMARVLLEICGATMSLIVLTIAFSSLGMMSLPDDVWTVIVGWILLAWFAVGLSLVVGAASEQSEFVERVWHIITYLLFPLSGAGFMVDWLPKVARDLAYWVPMIHGTEMIRHGFFGNMVRTYEDPLYLAAVNTVLTLFGLALVIAAGRKVEPE
ncbi:MAG: ABC transporter permease [Pseudomonadota bacterium]